ncbi:MAG: hypothetical protein HY070_11905 [Chloroflexi bacterium]|nr:hypothetical protein [Chloroflexota bacterium]
MSLVGFYIEVVRALDAIDAPYMIVGAFAASTYGLSRTTYDIDIIVDLQAQHFDLLASRFPLPRYYADPNQMRDSTQLGIMFNLIDTQRGAKADLVPLSREPKYRQAPFEAWCARPEDIIVGKLRAWTEGKSVKHPNDIYAMLVFIFGGYSDVQLDLDYVAHNAFEVGKETIELWRDLVERAKEETQK